MKRDVTSDSAVRVFNAIFNERVRQDDLRDAGKFPWTYADVAPFPPSPGIAPLGEEFGEVCRAVCEGDVANLREELIQLAACCVAWVEGIDAARDEAPGVTWHPDPTDPDYIVRGAD